MWAISAEVFSHSSLSLVANNLKSRASRGGGDSVRGRVVGVSPSVQQVRQCSLVCLSDLSRLSDLSNSDGVCAEARVRCSFLYLLTNYISSA